MVRHAASLSLAFALLFAPGKARSQFEIQDSGTTADLRGIVSVGNGVAWASGTHGTVLRTEDSGFVWQGCAMPPGAEKLDFRGIQAFDNQTAIVMSSGKGDLSRVYKTTDGCLSWKPVFTNPDADGFFDAIQALSRKKFRVLGDPVQGKFPIFALSEDAAAFNTQRFGIPAAPDEAAFAASNSSLLLASDTDACLVSGGARVEFSCLQGQSGNYRSSIPIRSSASSGAFAVARNPASTHLIVVGGDYLKPDSSADVAAWSNDGREWLKAENMPHGYRSSVAYDTRTRIWITVGPNGTDISRDDGKNWQPLQPGKEDQPDADRNWNALSLPFVVGPHGRIGRLRDNALDPPPAR